MRAVAGFLVADVPLGETLERIALLAREAIDPAVAVGLTLLDERGRPATAVATGDMVLPVDQSQYDEGDGPCLDAYREQRLVTVDDTREVADRWPRFSEEAVAAGVLSTLSLPLQAGDEAFGAFNLYADRPDTFGRSDVDDAELFSTQAGIVLANARAYWAAFDLAASLDQAMRSRAVIEQAKGKIMATNGCTPDDAFAILAKASQRENVKLRDIARRIVETPAAPGPATSRR